ncbi:MAG: hypothetical protein ACI9MC_001305 [Kiritimatiellia bacterium]|jgi:hypothetical protein
MRMSIDLVPVSFPKDTTRFCKVWWNIYATDPHWVPPLIFERKQFFDPKKNPYFNTATIQGWIARKDGKDVGTIVACHDTVLNDQIDKMGSFGFFEFIDDVEVAQALLDAAGDWLRDRGMNRLMGPYNLSTNHEFALLVDGFDTDPCVANPHNSAYYPVIYDKIGLKPNMTWYAYWMNYEDRGPARMGKLAERILKRNDKIKVRQVDLSRFDEELRLLKDIYNDAWHENWGHVPVSQEEFDYIGQNMKAIIQQDLCYIIEIDGKAAALSITFPDLNQVAKKMNGRLLPFGWYHWVFGKKKIDKLRIFILGVKKEYQHMPLGAVLYAETWKAGSKRKVIGGEASLILHHNVRMRGALEKMGAYIYKTYQSFELPLTDDAPPIHDIVGEIVPGKPIGWSASADKKS